MTSCLAGLTVLLGCGQTSPSSSDRPAVVVGIPPLGAVVERLAGDAVSVQVLAKAGACAHDFALAPQQMRELARARLFLTVGLPFETRLAARLHATNARLAIIDVADEAPHACPSPPTLPPEQDKGTFALPPGRRELLHEEHDADEHAGCDHEHEGPAAGTRDPHLWLDPSAARRMAANVAAALKEALPRQSAAIDARLAALDAELQQVAQHAAERLGPHRGATLLVYHPSLGALAAAYGLKQVAVEVNDRAPNPRQLHELVRQARALGVKTIFVEQQDNRRPAELLAEATGCKIATYDPLAPDLPENIERIVELIADGL